MQVEFFPAPDVDPLSSGVICCLRVADVDELYNAIRRSGVPEKRAGMPRLHPCATKRGAFELVFSSTRTARNPPSSSSDSRWQRATAAKPHQYRWTAAEEQLVAKILVWNTLAMNRQLPLITVATLVAMGTLSGCSPGPSTGSVAVEVRSMSPDSLASSYDITVRDADDEIIAVREVSVQSSEIFDDVPFGRVTVEADGMCSGESELSPETPRLRLVISAENCTVTD